MANEPEDIRIREATIDDLPLLFEARHNMFAEFAGSVHPEHHAIVDAAVAAFLRQTAKVSPIGFIAEDEAGELVGAVSVAHESTVPSLHNMSGRQSYLYGMWVRSESRRQGVARELVATAIEASRAVGSGAVTLMTSEEGRGVCESLGFVSVPAMRLAFEPLFDPHARDDTAG